MLCFSRLTYAVVKVLLEIKLIAQFEPSILSTKFKAFTFKLGMTGSWGHPADTSKSHSNRAQLQQFGDGDKVRSVEVRRLELLTSCLQSRRSTN